MFVSSALEHTDHDPERRDSAIRWVGAFLIAVKQFVRDEQEISRDELAGFLTDDEDLRRLSSASHPALYAATEIRRAVALAFAVTENDSPALSTSRCFRLKSLERSIESFVAQVGGMERIRATPLPMVYLTHLRTFLFFYLASLPYLHAEAWGSWATVPTTALVAFALLGIDGAASECEIPFRRRANHLDMETYCAAAMNNVQQLVLHAADLRLQERRGDVIVTSVGLENNEEEASPTAPSRRRSAEVRKSSSCEEDEAENVV